MTARIKWFKSAAEELQFCFHFDLILVKLFFSKIKDLGESKLLESFMKRIVALIGEMIVVKIVLRHSTQTIMKLFIYTNMDILLLQHFLQPSSPPKI